MTARTEPPSPRKLERMRSQGDSPISGALVQAATFLVVVTLGPRVLDLGMDRATRLLRGALEGEPSPPARALVYEVSVLLVPLLTAAALTAVAAGMVQTGAVFAPKRLGFGLGRLNPLARLRDLSSGQRLVGGLRSLFAAGLVGWFAVKLLAGSAGPLAGVVGRPEAALSLSGSLVSRLLWLAAWVGLGLAAVDVLVSRRAWLGRHRMSRRELAREHRELEGDPQIRAARRRAREELLRSATLAAVPDASVLVIEPPHLAAALRYADGDEAPRLVGLGQGELARRMVEAGKSHGVPSVIDFTLARALRELPIGDEIPEALYEPVAEILGNKLRG